MTLRSRVTLAAVVAVLVSLLGVSALVYVSISRELRRQVDVTLKGQGDRLVASPQFAPGQAPGPGPVPAVSSDDQSSVFTDSYLQILDEAGHVRGWVGQAELPVTPLARSVATGQHPASFEDVTVDGTHVRVYTVATSSGAFRFGRSLAEVERSLNRLTLAMVVVGVTGVLFAGGLGALTARTSIRPVHELSEAARSIKRTGDLSERLPARGKDEVTSLALSFNQVLDELETSQRLQRQLVADASHELRTPLTTLRTNIEVLGRGHDLADADRDRIIGDLNGQLADLTDLVSDLVDLARDESVEVTAEPVDLDELAREVVARAQRQRPQLRFEVEGVPTVVVASPSRVDRAISNLVDNAAKWSPSDGRVRVVIADHSVTVSDEGPGIAESDLPHVFDRFYRSPGARRMPGSGLGLAIVRQVAHAHGGAVEATNAPTGGAVLTIRFPPDATAAS